MSLRDTSTLCFAAALAGAIALSWTTMTAQQRDAMPAIDGDDIGGIVRSAKGPEAGVWVIAESTDLPTTMARIVVTDDRGRFVVPDLPRANYQVFVRGYGLVDSPRQPGRPGQQLQLEVSVAPNARAAAEVYPAAWWLSMAEIPAGPMEPQKVADQVRGCLNCHQVGGKATREIPPRILAVSKTHLDAWDFRTQMGPVGPAMGASFKRLGAQRTMLSDWSERIAKGEAPKIAPPRPTGIERNVVVTWWDWGSELDGRTDGAPTDVNHPTVNANGPLYGVSQPTDLLMMLDPLENRATSIKIPSRAPATGSSRVPSPYWDQRQIWERQADPRSVAVDAQGRVWFTGRIRDAANPAFCTANAFGKYYPLETGRRQVLRYDPKTTRFTEIDTCFTADHNQIGRDGVMYFGMNNAIGWLDTAAYDKTGNAETSQGWCPAVLDTTGDGKIGAYTKVREPIDPLKDRQVAFDCYSVSVNPKDGAAWCSGIGPDDNKLVRLERGSHPPDTCKAEVYEAPPTGLTPPAHGTGGIHVDRHGVVWQNWRGSGHFSAFDRSKCRVTTGPNATGQSCPEGWTFHRRDGATYANAPSIFSDESYLTHLDEHDTLGLGADVPVYANVNTDSLEAFVPKSKQFVTLRVPYPLGFFARSAVGRIDDAKAGWKGKGFWSTYSTYAAWHVEGGKGVKQKALKFQIRPDALAK